MGNPEFEADSEQLYTPRKSLVITISGVSGTGKTRTGHDVAETLGLEFIKIGGALRQEAKAESGTEIISFYDRSIAKDYELDRKTLESFNEARETGKGFVVEGWLAGFHAYKELDRACNVQQNSALLYRLCFTAGDETSNVRYSRILNRQRRSRPDLTLEQIKEATEERFSADLKNWWEAYPELNGINPWDVGEGRPAGIFYNQIIDTEHMSVPQVVQGILDNLVYVDLVEKSGLS